MIALQLLYTFLILQGWILTSVLLQVAFDKVNVKVKKWVSIPYKVSQCGVLISALIVVWQ